MQRFDTEHLPIKDRFAYWADEFGGSVGYIALDSPERADFHQWLSIVDIASLRLARLHGSPVSSTAEPGQVKDVDLHPFQLMLKVDQGPSSIRQDTEAIVETGDLVLIDSLQKMQMQAHGAANSLLIGLPKLLVARWLPDAEDAVAQRLDGAKGWSSLLAAYLNAMSIDHAQAIGSPFEQELVGEHILSMLSFALSQNGLTRDRETVSSRDRALHLRMYNWIRDNYADPEVSASKLAARFHVSVRYVHKVFASAGRGITFLDVLQHERLEAAVRMLRTASVSHTFVAQIAYRCGFSDPAYFGLVFRKKYGCSPRAFASSKGRSGVQPTGQAPKLEENQLPPGGEAGKA
ncbi:AraC family transcriptional regulator [Variovorax sp. DXTD-1]|uniref:AraC family transcriptional regulator n=1 Tax=Variovorax sp. DXTD-1 TaxID=2495592 RepID=UPI00163CC9EA|nr:AraC family transcriptional regulator [Variovorax sp. DXTD-1]